MFLVHNIFCYLLVVGFFSVCWFNLMILYFLSERQLKLKTSNIEALICVIKLLLTFVCTVHRIDIIYIMPNILIFIYFCFFFLIKLNSNYYKYLWVIVNIFMLNWEFFFFKYKFWHFFFLFAKIFKFVFKFFNFLNLVSSSVFFHMRCSVKRKKNSKIAFCISY